MKDVRKKLGQFGPGGIDCPCCGLPPGKSRKQYWRILKKRDHREAMRLEEVSETEPTVIDRRGL